MAMGKRKARQQALFLSYNQLAQSPGHPFYQSLNQLLDEAGFDRWVEARCQPHYKHEEKGGLPWFRSAGLVRCWLPIVVHMIVAVGAGETAAIFYTLAMSCKRHAIDMQAYLLDVFRRIKHASQAELESLLPDRWIEQHPEARIRQPVQESQAAAARKRWRRARRRVAVASG